MTKEYVEKTYFNGPSFVNIHQMKRFVLEQDIDYSLCKMFLWRTHHLGDEWWRSLHKGTAPKERLTYAIEEVKEMVSLYELGDYVIPIKDAVVDTSDGEIYE